MTVKEPIGWELSISARDDGTLEAVYVLLSDAKVSRTEEIQKDVLLADYDSEGELVGIEILAPVRIADLVKLVDQERRKHFRRFIERRAPEEYVLE